MLSYSGSSIWFGTGHLQDSNDNIRLSALFRLGTASLQHPAACLVRMCRVGLRRVAIYHAGSPDCC